MLPHARGRAVKSGKALPRREVLRTWRGAASRRQQQQPAVCFALPYPGRPSWPARPPRCRGRLVDRAAFPAGAKLATGVASRLHPSGSSPRPEAKWRGAGAGVLYQALQTVPAHQVRCALASPAGRAGSAGALVFAVALALPDCWPAPRGQPGGDADPRPGLFLRPRPAFADPSRRRGWPALYRFRLVRPSGFGFSPALFRGWARAGECCRRGGTAKTQAPPHAVGPGGHREAREAPIVTAWRYALRGASRDARGAAARSRRASSTDPRTRRQDRTGPP